MIGGNTILTIVGKTVTTEATGIQKAEWNKNLYAIKGFLDYITGEANLSPNYQKLEQSSHVFIADYVNLKDIKAEEVKGVINGELYDIKLIDDPMGLKEHLEIYLNYVGGQNAS